MPRQLPARLSGIWSIAIVTETRLGSFLDSSAFARSRETSCRGSIRFGGEGSFFFSYTPVKKHCSLLPLDLRFSFPSFHWQFSKSIRHIEQQQRRKYKRRSLAHWKLIWRWPKAQNAENQLFENIFAGRCSRSEEVKYFSKLCLVVSGSAQKRHLSSLAVYLLSPHRTDRQKSFGKVNKGIGLGWDSSQDYEFKPQSKN